MKNLTKITIIFFLIVCLVVTATSISQALQAKNSITDMKQDIEDIKVVYNIEYIYSLEQDIRDLQELTKTIQEEYQNALSKSLDAMSDYISIGTHNKDSVDGLTDLLDDTRTRLKQLEDNTKGGAVYQIYEGN